MKMTNKISITASALLFLLAQIFSFYLLYQNHMDKLDLVQKNEWKKLEQGVDEMLQKIPSMSTLEFENQRIRDNLIIQAFRKFMPENSAIYIGEISVYNNSGYEFQKINRQIAGENKYISSMNTTLNHKNLMVWYLEKTMLGHKYMIYHVLDVTYIYDRSRTLIQQNIVISFFLSLVMTVLLNFLVHKITKPLQDINESQRQLIGNLSHELKTPLTAMKGYSETILKVNLSKEQEEKALSYINSECDRLSRLSEKMMQLTNLYEPEHGIMVKELKLSSLLESVHHTVAPVLKEKEIELLIQVKPENLTKKLDPDLMTSLLINLVNNGVMASRIHGRIWMKADDKMIQVRDEGCGISKEDINKVKLAFYRADKSRSRKSGNLGLGLTLCEQIAKVHGAKLLIESREECGTTISFIYEFVTNK